MKHVAKAPARPPYIGRPVADTRAWLFAGTVAIAINTALLQLAAGLGIQTGQGGLLQLIRPVLAPLLRRLGVASAWASTALPPPGSAGFKDGFHVLVGLAMAAVYAWGERYLPWRPWVKGLAYALAVYLANALILLPVIGQGLAGSRTASAGGLVYFAFAHTTFFVLLALLYARWRRPAP